MLRQRGSRSSPRQGAARELLAERAPSEKDADIARRLRGKLESLHGNLVAEGDGLDPISVDDYIEKIGDGKWPGDKDRWPSGTDDPRSPRLWIGLARFAEEYTEEFMGEDWEVIDFSYPFPDNDPVPVPATRDEDSHVDTMLICMSGRHKGCVAVAEYCRWSDSPSFGFGGDGSYAEPDEALSKWKRNFATAMSLTGKSGWDVLCGDGTAWVMPPAGVPTSPVPDVLQGVVDEGSESWDDDGTIHWMAVIPHCEEIELEAGFEYDEYPNNHVETVPIADARSMIATGIYTPVLHYPSLQPTDQSKQGLAGNGSGSVTGMSYDNPEEAFADAGFAMSYPNEEIFGFEATDFQVFHLQAGTLISIEYWPQEADPTSLLPFATIRKESGGKVTMGDYSKHSMQPHSVEVDGTEVMIDGDDAMTFAEWSKEDGDGQIWGYSVVIWQQTSDDMMASIVRWVS